MVSPLDRKLLRDLASLRGQVVTIALVVACGIASYIAMRSAYDSLVQSRDSYYASNRFADVFASLKRAPVALGARLGNIRGVVETELRVVESALVPVEGMPRPASGVIVGVGRHSEGALNQLYLMLGRPLDPRRADEVLVIEGFAEAHHLGPGDSLAVVVNGTLRNLKIVGIALSPEYIMPIAPGQLTYDPALSPILWMNEAALAAAFQMEGAFNTVSLRVARDANIRAVQAELDALLKPYGGLGSVSREKQISNYILSGELSQLDRMAGFVPYLFLAVAALLVNVVLARLVQLERGTIATLKAVGYPDRAITFHYLKLVSIIVGLGALLGVGVGVWVGSGMMDMYTGKFFRFPHPHYLLRVRAVIFSVGISVLSAVFGAWFSVRHIAKMPPAEAMQPPAPARFRRSIFERMGLLGMLGPAGRMVWRELSRRPLRLVLSSAGIALAVGINVVSRSMVDSMEYLIDVQFHRSMRESFNVTLTRPLDKDVLSSFRHLPGVFFAEGLRAVPVRLHSGHIHRDTVFTGYPDEPMLRQLVDGKADVHLVPEEGVVLTSKLAEILEVRPGDLLEVELREGTFRSAQVQLVGVVDEPFGLAGHMSQRALRRLVRDAGPIQTVLLATDPNQTAELENRLKTLPTVANVSSPRDFNKQFDEQSAAIMNVFTFIMSLFAGVIAVGVIYNNARVALSQRNRDLASLRVLGFTRREIAAILFGEQAVQVAIAVPPGLWIGQLLARAMMSNADPETYRLPVTISPRTYVFAVLVTLGAAALSALLLRQKLEKLDLIGVLKTRE